MKLVDLAILYLVLGVVCGATLLYRAHPRTPRALASAALAIPLWPFWAPVALSAHRPAPIGSPAASAVDRILAALNEGLAAVEGTSLSALLPVAAVANIMKEVERIRARFVELEALLARPDLSPALAAERVAQLEARGASPRALAPARLHQENIRRLTELRARDQRALDELLDLVVALRTQLVLARYAGSSVEGVGGIVSEMWARVEGLGTAMDVNVISSWPEEYESGHDALSSGSATLVGSGARPS